MNSQSQKCNYVLITSIIFLNTGFSTIKCYHTYVFNIERRAWSTHNNNQTKNVITPKMTGDIYRKIPCNITRLSVTDVSFVYLLLQRNN